MSDRHQTVVVYTKLASFKTAGQQVRGKLAEILQGIDVVEYDHGRHIPGLVTAVVVLDVKQTRTLITPRRRDQSVDHWDELSMLNKNTSPKGSILIVLYNDEDSATLGENDIISKRWLQVWNHNDTLAKSLSEKGRCFSIFENFNELQKSRIKSYFHDISYVPDIKHDSDVSVVVIGGIGTETNVKKLLFEQPLLTVGGSEDAVDTTLDYFCFEQSGYPTRKKTVSFNSSIEQVKVCECGRMSIAMQSQMNNFTTMRYGATTSKHSLVAGLRRRDIDRVLLLCHCTECFRRVIRERKEACAEIQRIGFKMRDGVYPLLRGGDDATDVSDLMLECVTEFRQQIDPNATKYRDQVEPSMLYKTYVWHACQTPSKTTTSWKFIAVCIAVGLVITIALIILVVLL